MDKLSETLIILCWELYEQGVPKSHIAQRLSKRRETIHIWIKGIQENGLLNFLDKYEQAKKGKRKKRQVDPIVKRVGLGDKGAGIPLLRAGGPVFPES